MKNNAIITIEGDLGSERVEGSCGILNGHFHIIYRSADLENPGFYHVTRMEIDRESVTLKRRTYSPAEELAAELKMELKREGTGTAEHSSHYGILKFLTRVLSFRVSDFEGSKATADLQYELHSEGESSPAIENRLHIKVDWKE